MADRRKRRQNLMKVRVVLFIIVFALMLAVIFALLNGMDIFEPQASEVPEPSGSAKTDSGNSGSQSGSQQGSSANPIIITTPDPSDVPPPAAQTTPDPSPDPSPEPTPETSPEPSAEPTPEPSPEVTSEPEISGVQIGAGTFRSDTGISFNIVADWKAVSLPEGKAEVTVSVSLESRMLQTRSQPLRISLGTQKQTVYAPAVDYDESAPLVTPMGSVTFTIDLAQGDSITLPLEAEWEFQGKYSGKDYPTLSCGGDITLER